MYSTGSVHKNNNELRRKRELTYLTTSHRKPSEDITQVFPDLYESEVDLAATCNDEQNSLNEIPTQTPVMFVDVNLVFVIAANVLLHSIICTTEVVRY